MSDPSDGFTAEERGDTVGRGTRILIRALAALVLVVATLGVAWIRERDQRAENAANSPSPARSTNTAEEATEPALAHAAREVKLLEAEDARLREISMGGADAVSRVDGTLVLGARRTPYTLADLLRAGAATRVSSSIVLVNEPVAVRRDARLEIHAPGTELRLLSTPEQFASLVSWGGSIALGGTLVDPLEVTGWDTTADRPDSDPTDGRAYVRVKDGSLWLNHVALSDLGFWSGRTGGLSLTGSDETVATAKLNDVRMTDLHIGFYVSGAQKVRVDGATIRRPERHGVELTNGSHDINLNDVVVSDAGEDGVSVSNGTSRVSLTGATISGSGMYGVDVDGSPLADGPNSAGYGIGNYAGLRLAGSSITGNERGGVRISSVDRVAVVDGDVSSERRALVVEGESTGVTILNTTLVSAHDPGLVLADGVEDASLRDSTVTGERIGVEIDDSVAILEGNTITTGTGHGVRVSGDDAEVTLSDNTINGRGSGAVAARDGASVTQDGESAGDWTYRPEVFMWSERHSAAAPLLLVLVIPVVGLIFILRRRQQQRELRRLLEETLVAQGRAAISMYQGRSDPVAVAAPVLPPVLPLVAEPVDEVEVEPVVEQPPFPLDPTSQAASPLALSGREFTTAQEFAIAAVIDAGYSPSMVARALNVPTSRVREWVSQARAEVPEDDRVPV